ncbi:hypothetical protein PATA110615_31730 [Paenibacillus taichungensis]
MLLLRPQIVDIQRLATRVIILGVMEMETSPFDKATVSFHI